MASPVPALQVSHAAPEVGTTYEWEEVLRSLTYQTLHGLCRVGECPRKQSLELLKSHMRRHGLKFAQIAPEMLPG